MIFAIVIGTFAVIMLADYLRIVRHRRHRDQFRHITGATPWWGQR